MKNDLVRCSRAGDVFHYRWAARRCLRLIEPNTLLNCITIEGSKENEKEGEYAIDLAEYSKLKFDKESVVYYQLKHSTIRTNLGFTLTAFKQTLSQFAARYLDLLKADGARQVAEVRFKLVTNRKISESLKGAVSAIRLGKEHPSRKAFERVTNLSGERLREFCSILELVGGEGDYLEQKHQLRGEMADYLIGSVERNEVDGLIALVNDRALPESEEGRSDGKIYREDVFQRLDVTSERQLFPAPPKYEALISPIKRDQHDDLLKQLLSSTTPTIVHATGGVGKSVVANQLIESLPSGSWGLVYDCFGAGNYRNESEPRHLARHAMVQMANEMAMASLCYPLIARSQNSNEDLFRGFLERLGQAIATLRNNDREAKILLLVDAADNAEMVAEDNGDRCFASALLREKMPEGCHIGALCRTERVHYLQPASTVSRYELQPFSLEETTEHMRAFHPAASNADVLEFHRLTSGNGRVQSNALSVTALSVTEVLQSLGPTGSSVDEQISAQLASAVAGIKDRHPRIFSKQIEAICLGLANLPPFIPLSVLAKAAAVDPSEIESFVHDLGRPLWLSDGAVQFRDEPTETWFRSQYAGRKDQILSLIEGLDPISSTSTYAARALPQLLHRAGELTSLVNLALSDRMLPEDNPIDARDIRVYRLQFAFKAAIKLDRLSDACRIAFRAGEEMAGDQRQMDLLAKNIDLIPLLQSTHRVQELAYRRLFQSGWRGSENAYSAALLSSVEQFKGEARGYLRSAGRWMQIYFDRRKKEKDPAFSHERITTADVVEMAWAHLNLFGSPGATEFLISWRPPDYTFEVSRLFFRRLVDGCLFEKIDEISVEGKGNVYLILAAADELMPVGRFPPKKAIFKAVNRLAGSAFKLGKAPHYSSENCIYRAILSLCEAGVYQGINAGKILAILNKYTSQTADSDVADDYFDEPRRTFMRAASLRSVLEGGDEPAPEVFIKKRDEKDGGSRTNNSDQELKEAIGSLLPLFFLRARMLARYPGSEDVSIFSVRERAKRALYSRHRSRDRLPYEVSVAWFSVLVVAKRVTLDDIGSFIHKVVQNADRKISLKERLLAARAAFRLPHLSGLRVELERSCLRAIESYTEQTPEERAEEYVDLARIVLPHSLPDASAYFSSAVEAVSKFGDEIGDRWNAIASVARSAVNRNNADQKLIFRFVKCAEMVDAADRDLDREELFRIVSQLHAPSAFSVLSRWRDRAVGSFAVQLRALASALVETGEIAPSIGWSLTGFAGCNAHSHYAALCIARETDVQKKKVMLEISFRDLQLAGVSVDSFRELSAVASEFPVLNEEICKCVRFHSAEDIADVESRGFVEQRMEHADLRVESLLKGVDVVDLGSLRDAVKSMNLLDYPRDFQRFWRAVVGLVPVGKEVKFLDLLPVLEGLSYTSVGDTIDHIREVWIDKASVKKVWRRFMFGIGRRFAVNLSDRYRMSFLSERGHLSELEVDDVMRGVIEGLADSSDIVGARTFFGFVSCVAGRLPWMDAAGLLDYSLGRMEEHIPKDFGDGEWDDILNVTGTTSDAVCGLLWSALGSPCSSTRWEAVHCVRRLGSLGCRSELATLIGKLKSREVGAFGSRIYPFYYLHSRLYLLFALCRVSIDRPEMLASHAEVFSEVALEGFPHILVQRNAADIALRIEAAENGSYSIGVLEKLRNIGVSQFPPRLERSGEVFDSPWHLRGEVDLSIHDNLEYEFNWYWFTQIATIFGIGVDQIEQLARDIVVKDLGIALEGGYKPDPRSDQWNSIDYHDGGTRHSHGSYPNIDSYRFYYSYHSFLMVASKLLENVPVIKNQRDDSDFDRWSDWLRRHSLTRADGRWISDRRDPSPTRRGNWVKLRNVENWRWSIQRDDFKEVILNQSCASGYLSVWGSWTDFVESNVEDITVRTAFVNREAAMSLAASIRSNRNYSPVPISDEEHEEDDLEEPPFELEGWIASKDGRGTGLDGFDPHAKSLRYPPYKIRDKYASMLGLKSDTEGRRWFLPGDDSFSIINEIWSDKIASNRGEIFRSGERVSASVKVLKDLCLITGKDLIFCVEIHRWFHRHHRSSRGEEEIYVPNSIKVFLMSYDGVLRDVQESYEVG